MLSSEHYEVAQKSGLPNAGLWYIISNMATIADNKIPGGASPAATVPTRTHDLGIHHFEQAANGVSVVVESVEHPNAATFDFDSWSDEERVNRIHQLLNKSFLARYVPEYAGMFSAEEGAELDALERWRNAR